MELRIKLPVIKSSDGFDFFGRPTTCEIAKQEIRAAINRRESFLYSKDLPKGRCFFWMEKRNKVVRNNPIYTKFGKLAKKQPAPQVIKTHWKYRVYFVDQLIIDLLHADGKKIVQRKHHWEIVSK